MSDFKKRSRKFLAPVAVAVASLLIGDAVAAASIEQGEGASPTLLVQAPIGMPAAPSGHYSHSSHSSHASHASHASHSSHVSGY